MAATKVPERDKRGTRTGFTTGACSAAAARAATRYLVQGQVLQSIVTRLPNRDEVEFVLERCDRSGDVAICSIIKDAGDDPDCTHGAELVAEVRLTCEAKIVIRGGSGVAKVTKAGLGLEVGIEAINPVPRRNITEMVQSELEGSKFAGAHVTISVPGGEEMALKTTNERLGLLGGISILGTSGIVRPYSTAAFRASVVQEIDVAQAAGLRQVVLTTGGKSEKYAMALHPQLEAQAFIQVGDFVGVALKHAARRGFARATIVGMMGKLSKMAMGKMQTHVAGSQVDMTFLASTAEKCGAPESLLQEILQANTARHVLELCTAAGIDQVPNQLCAGVSAVATAHAKDKLEVHVYLTDFGGKLLGQLPLEADPTAELPAEAPLAASDKPVADKVEP